MSGPGHQFNPQQQINPMNQMVGNVGGHNTMGPNTQVGMSMGGYAQMGGGGMNPVGMQSSHVQMLQQQHLQQMQQQQQQQQMNTGISHMGLPQHMQGSAMPQQQQQQQNLQGGNMLAIPQQNPHKEINIVSLSRLGQETVQDITSRFQEIFAAMKVIQPSGNRDNNNEKKVQEYFRTIRLLFKRVRIIYEKCNDGYPQGMEYTNVESLVPFKDEPEHRIEPSQCEEYRKALQENQELIETVKLKNRHLREIIDRTRIIIWEINTMLSMRRS